MSQKVYIAYTTVEYEESFSIIGVFSLLKDAVMAVIDTFGNDNIKFDDDSVPNPDIIYGWDTNPTGEYISIAEIEMNKYTKE